MINNSKEAPQAAAAEVSRVGGPDDSRSCTEDARVGGPDDSRSKASPDQTRSAVPVQSK